MKLNEINKVTARAIIEKVDEAVVNGVVKTEGISNSGKATLDVTCVPADIKYHTDINLLNIVCGATEEIIDIFYKRYKRK